MAILSERRTDHRERALRSVGELPPFSPILNRLLASLAAEEVSFSKLGDLIEKDTVVAGNVLHLVNSALYARRGTINSVRHAVSILGITKLRNAVLGMSISRMWNRTRTPAGWSMARFNQHSAATAILSDLLAQRARVDYPEGAFVAGLLHDVGRLLMALSLREESLDVAKLYETAGGSLVECERELIGVTHPELSAEALAVWNLPAPIQAAVRFHHHPELDRTEIAPGELTLSAVIDAANQFVNARGVAISAGVPHDASNADRIHELGLTGDQLPRVIEDFEKEYEAIGPFFK